MKICILGTRGIPARYGGFETFAEQLSTRLVKKGHQVTVYGRHFKGEKRYSYSYDDVECLTSLTLRSKYFETPIAALTSFLDIKSNKFDVVLLCNAATTPFAVILKLKKIPFAVNVDGIERFRSKWGFAGRLWYRIGEITSQLWSNKVVSDAQAIDEYYRSTYGKPTTVIAYGADYTKVESGIVHELLNIQPDNYLLYVSRLEPENNALGVIEAYNSSGINMPLVIVGDAPYATDYKDKLKKNAKGNIIFAGFRFGEEYKQLQSNCYLYIQATEVGGTHPALLESMAFGNCIVANSTPEHMEALGGAGTYYSHNNFIELSKILKKLIANPLAVKQYRTLAKQRCLARYPWSKIVDEYEELFNELRK
jgi:glycosyltransferase involved in cell wall biosynthesis